METRTENKLKKKVSYLPQKFNVNKKEVLTLEEAAAYTGYSELWLQRLVRKGAIPCSRPTGKRVFFSRKSLNAWLMSRPVVKVPA